MQRHDASPYRDPRYYAPPSPQVRPQDPDPFHDQRVYDDPSRQDPFSHNRRHTSPYRDDAGDGAAGGYYRPPAYAPGSASASPERRPVQHPDGRTAAQVRVGEALWGPAQPAPWDGAPPGNAF